MLMFSLFVLSFVFISETVYAFSFGGVYSALFGSVLSVFDTSDTVPVINIAYLDKQKYMPGEQMMVTASVSGAEYVKVYIENDVGVDEVDMILVTGTKADGTWQAAWTLHDTQTKEYFAKIVAVSDDEIEVEKVLMWFDPTVSHSWDETSCDNNLCVDTINNRVGIGTTTPIETFDVDGSIAITEGNYLRVTKDDGSRYSLIGLSESGQPITVGAAATVFSGINFYPGTGDSIFTSGNVGVGMSPTTKLEVNGIVTATAFVGDGSGLTNVGSGSLSSVFYSYTACPGGWTDGGDYYPGGYNGNSWKHDVCYIQN